MYQALYRKWRPRDFDSIVGQEHITSTLKNAISFGKFSHAYLFTGSRGTGKTSCAKIVAKAVNCLNPLNGNPCNQCSNCRGIDDGSILDVSEIDAASNNSVDNIRELREEALFMPTIAKYRVYILDECHMLSASAVNALLKILEEPPEHVIFILATTELHKVLPTILSRCQRFDFKRIKSRIIADRLLYVCQQEKIILCDDAAMLIARLSDGGMRDALSLLDLCISHTENITCASVTETVGLGSQEQLFSLTDAINSSQPAQALETIEALSQDSVDFIRLCEQLIQHYRNLMLIKATKEPEDLITAIPEDLQRMRIQSKTISMNRVLYVLQQLQDTMGRLSRTPFKRTELEMVIICLSIEATQIPTEIQPIPVAVVETPPIIPVSIPVSSEIALFQDWPKVLAQLKSKNGALAGFMLESKAYSTGDRILIDCSNEMFREMLRTSPATKETLRDAIFTVTGHKYSLGPYNPNKYKTPQNTSNPLSNILKLANELNVPMDIK